MFDVGTLEKWNVSLPISKILRLWRKVASNIA